jgi:VCBS repeat-containing protein
LTQVQEDVRLSFVRQTTLPQITTKEAKMKTYGIAITAGGVQYHFHVDTIKKVRELFTGSRFITEFTVVEQDGNGYYQNPEHRTMTDAEVQDIIWGRAA